jgi:hypothetical protein
LTYRRATKYLSAAKRGLIAFPERAARSTNERGAKP